MNCLGMFEGNHDEEERKVVKPEGVDVELSRFMETFKRRWRSTWMRMGRLVPTKYVSPSQS